MPAGGGGTQVPSVVIELYVAGMQTVGQGTWSLPYLKHEPVCRYSTDLFLYWSTDILKDIYHVLQ
jgi:hypothetical protein